MRPVAHHVRPLVAFTLLLAVASGCGVSRSYKEASPKAHGFTFAVSPGMQLRESRASAHPLVGYTRVEDPGGMSHTQLLQVGAQLRYALTDRAPNGFWVGGEVAWLQVTSIPDGISMRPKANGHTFGALAGYRFEVVERLPASAFVSYARFHRDGFAFGGGPAGPGLDGNLVKAGLELHLASRFHPRGR